MINTVRSAGLCDKNGIRTRICAADNLESTLWSAQVDGCNWLEAFWRVFLLVSVHGLVSALTFTFLMAWNEFMVAWILATRAEVQTVTLAVVGLATTLWHHIDDSPGSASVVGYPAMPYRWSLLDACSAKYDSIGACGIIGAVRSVVGGQGTAVDSSSSATVSVYKSQRVKRRRKQCPSRRS